MVVKEQNSAVHYVGEIGEINGKVAKINYLRKSGGKFIFPECQDCAKTDFQDITYEASCAGFSRRNWAGSNATNMLTVDSWVSHMAIFAIFVAYRNGVYHFNYPSCSLRMSKQSSCRK